MRNLFDEFDNDFEETRMRINVMFALGMLVTTAMWCGILYAGYFLVTNPEAIGTWAGTVVSSFKASAAT